MVPSSRRIIEDIRKIVTALKKIVAAEGCVVHGWMKRPGHRGNAAAEGAPANRVKNHGGKRVKKKNMSFFALHEDAAEVERDFINQRINIVNNPPAVNDLRDVSTPAGGNLPRGDDLLEVPGDAGSVTSTGPVDDPL